MPTRWKPMERASLLEPVDPIVTDHLGDVYWMNDRKLEAVSSGGGRCLSSRPKRTPPASCASSRSGWMVMAEEAAAPAVKAAENGN
jgi:hypothetical protein